LSAAVSLLGTVPESKLVAGGMTLIPTIKQRLASPEALIDLTKLPQMKGCVDNGATITIGAMTSHAAVAASPVIRGRIAALSDLAAGIGDPAVRNRGTIGGSVANNDPSADYPAAVLGLNAIIVTSEREIAADAFFLGLFETALKPNEIITAIRVPLPKLAGYAKFKSPASRYALVGVFVACTPEGVRVAVTGAGPGVFRVPAMEHALTQNFEPSALSAIKIDADNLASDIHAEAYYRAHLVTVMAKRAVTAALSTSRNA
jgi:carbon-monoxide dehydrogenase medium subunit